MSISLLTKAKWRQQPGNFITIQLTKIISFPNRADKTTMKQEISFTAGMSIKLSGKQIYHFSRGLKDIYIF